jgi:hypothetical protein
MTNWQKLLKKGGRAPEWPYPIRYEQEQEIETDVLVLGVGIARTMQYFCSEYKTE